PATRGRSYRERDRPSGCVRCTRRPAYFIPPRRASRTHGDLWVGPLRRRACDRWTVLLVRGRFADGPQEIVGLGRHAQALVFGDLSSHVELIERVVQRLHTVLFPGLHRRLALVDLVVADQGWTRRRADRDIGGSGPAATLGSLRQPPRRPG